MSQLHAASCVAIGARAVLIEGHSGSGKSSLALALIDRGAVLIGDDRVRLEARGERLYASPPPTIAGLLEVRNLGLLRYPSVADLPVALVLRLDSQAPRFIEAAESFGIAGVSLPLVRLWPDSPMLALKAELALEHYGLA
jgi:serine kinase of HPr protein (carbohydrate metabolism regulator)